MTSAIDVDVSTDTETVQMSWCPRSSQSSRQWHHRALPPVLYSSATSIAPAPPFGHTEIQFRKHNFRRSPGTLSQLCMQAHAEMRSLSRLCALPVLALPVFLAPFLGIYTNSVRSKVTTSFEVNYYLKVANICLQFRTIYYIFQKMLIFVAETLFWLSCYHWSVVLCSIVLLASPDRRRRWIWRRCRWSWRRRRWQRCLLQMQPARALVGTPSLRSLFLLHPI